MQAAILNYNVGMHYNPRWGPAFKKNHHHHQERVEGKQIFNTPVSNFKFLSFLDRFQSALAFVMMSSWGAGPRKRIVRITEDILVNRDKMLPQN